MKLLKDVACEIGHPLAHIFNLSLKKGIFPNALKQSKVIPIYKGGDPELCDNYRPISLLNSISKILEKIVAVQLVNHLELNNLLNKFQFGFQKGKSTEQILLLVIDYISKAINEGEYCIGIFLDLKKAFDVCSHPILLKKLERVGIKGTTLNWFKSYLSNRTQKVEINGNLSDEKNINISVLQGSILGPILFLIMINDLPDASSLISFLFADDTSGLARGKNLNELIQHVNTELKKWATWFRANKLKVNTLKTKYIIFHRKNQKINMHNLEIKFDDNEPNSEIDPEKISILERVHNDHPDPSNRYYKLLGILLDENLTFDHHIQKLHSKLARSVYCINKVKNFLPKKALTTLYHSLIHSHLTYCTSIYSCTSKSNINKIFKIQKKAIRIISKNDYGASTEPIFKELNLLPLDKIILKSNLSMFHSIHHQYAPPALHNLWPKNAARNLEHELRNANCYYMPKINYSITNRFPFYNLPKIWNNYQGSSKLHSNRTTFSISLLNELKNDPPPPSSPPLPPDHARAMP